MKQLRSDQSAKRVHQVRTRTRRIETMVEAFSLDSRRNERRLLKALKPIRKKAGKVRDADVLIGFASQLKPQGEGNCSVRLLEHLGAQRLRRCWKLKKAAAAHAHEVGRCAKKFEQFLDNALKDGNAKTTGEKLSEEAAVLALRLTGELRRWPSLNRSNLHPFRLKVKELRYLLQMAEDQEKDSQFIQDLGEVKDAIGEWHDWEELTKTARHVIRHRACSLTNTIQSTTREKLERGLAVANQLRKRRLSPNREPRRQRTATRPTNIGESAIAAAATLAA
jgi:CHAD domain-containing protein